LREGFERSDDYTPKSEDWSQGCGQDIGTTGGDEEREGATGVDLETLREIGTAITEIPDDFNIHRKLKRILESKRELFESGDALDWSMGEALAFGSLLIEGYRVRLSGEDSNRGTFSQRHASWVDQETEGRYVSLGHIRKNQEEIEVIDSPLSEFGVLGFEYGYAMSDPMALVMWEAQFGDFGNGAQVIIDQFIASGESKWACTNGLVLLLPHGYEGQGPEHSSARLERFLQLCAEGNIQVVNCTTPANYFHVLRRQLHRDFRKPLVIMTPKSLLRHKRAVSDLEAFGPGTAFNTILRDGEAPSEPQQALRLILCSGKVYYDLLEGREERGIEDAHILRLEQIYPFPREELKEELSRYKHCELVWCQEEPRNMGAWMFVGGRIQDVARAAGCERPEPRYVGRQPAASPATGSYKRHVERQARLVEEALTMDEDDEAGAISKSGSRDRSGGARKRKQKRGKAKSGAGGSTSK
jgi:2-oxoglutarate dehydrogenase E1 component